MESSNYGSQFFCMVPSLWLYNIGKGEDREEVVPRQLAKSVGCGKNFLGRETLHTRKKVVEWTTALVEELAERLQEDQDMVGWNVSSLDKNHSCTNHKYFIA